MKKKKTENWFISYLSVANKTTYIKAKTTWLLFDKCKCQVNLASFLKELF